MRLGLQSAIWKLLEQISEWWYIIAVISQSRERHRPSYFLFWETSGIQIVCDSWILSVFRSGGLEFIIFIPILFAGIQGWLELRTVLSSYERSRGQVSGRGTSVQGIPAARTHRIPGGKTISFFPFFKFSKKFFSKTEEKIGNCLHERRKCTMTDGAF